MRFNLRGLVRFIARYGRRRRKPGRRAFSSAIAEEEGGEACRWRCCGGNGKETARGPSRRAASHGHPGRADAGGEAARPREALGGPEEQRARVADNASKRDDGSGDDGSRDSDASSDSDSDADADLEDVHIQTPSLAQMAYVKAATDAKLPIASRLVTERGMAPLEGEGVNVAFNWRVELFAAFKDVLETKKIYSRFFRAAPGVELRLGVYESWETLCVRRA